jgi:hypothetical protein
VVQAEEHSQTMNKQSAFICKFSSGFGGRNNPPHLLKALIVARKLKDHAFF